jgi:cytochrome P450
MDPPEHDQLRKIVRAYFTPQAVGELEERVRSIANELIDDFIADGEADLGAQFGADLPSRVITHMLGLPIEDAAKLSHWIHLSTDMPAPGQEHDDWAAGVMEGAGAMWVYLAEQLDKRRADSRGDMMSDIAHATIDGEPLSDSAVGMCFLLYGAGEDTSAGLITTMITTLAESESHREQLVSDLALIPGAIDEFMRWDGPFLHLARATTEDVTIHGVTIPAEARLLLLWSSANRDEREFADPDVLDFSRKRVAHLGFGHGLHHCIGHALAKLEARVAMTELLKRIPRFSLAGDAVFGNKPFLRSYKHVPVTFTPGGGA